MAKGTLGQEWPYARENSFLASKISGVSDFPDPMSYYSLYAVIIKEEPVNNMAEHSFAPFRGRAWERELLRKYGCEGNERRDYGYWIGTLTAFLGCPLLVEYVSDTNRKVKLTPFGDYMFPPLMDAFADLYRQNDRLKEVAAAYRPTQE